MPEFPPDTPVVIDCNWSSFHGLEGVVVGEDQRRRPLPFVLVYVPEADVAEHEKEVFFTTSELRHRRVDTTGQV